jgi:hypothetical protein
MGALDVPAITLRSAHELLLEDHDSGVTASFDRLRWDNKIGEVVCSPAGVFC